MPNRIDPTKSTGSSEQPGSKVVHSPQEIDERSLLNHLRRIYDPKALKLLRQLRATATQSESPETATNRAHPPGVSPS